MKLLLPALLCCFLFLNVNAQKGIIDGLPQDSVVYTFNTTDTIINDTTRFYIPRTTKDSLWQIGTTQKTFFAANGFANAGIMTDSVNHYPVNANSSFIIQPTGFYAQHLIVSFKHKYQTDSGRDGGIVEFSIDSGKTWRNVIGECNPGNSTYLQGILTDSFYSKKDTLLTGVPAFTGTSNGWRYSRFQFFHGFPFRTTGTTIAPDCLKAFPWIRFRFVSDTTADTLAGWIIDDIQFERDKYNSGINPEYGNAINFNVYPNPATGVVQFPALYRKETYTIQLYNILGAKVLDQPYTNKLDVGTYQRGMYYYRVSNGQYVYTGKLLLE